MSAIAIDLLDHLRQSGMADDKARKIAEAFDARIRETVNEALNEAKQHADHAADKAANQSAEKADAKFATKSEVEIREKQFTRREESESQFAKVLGAVDALRGELRETRAELKADIREARAEAKADIRELKKDIQYLRWGMAILLVFILTEAITGFFA